MAINHIEVNTVRLNSDITALRNTLATARAKVQALDEALRTMGNYWTGAANTAMMERFREDHEAMIEFCDFIEELINNLETIRQSYDTCEGNVLSAVNALRIN